MLKCLVLICAYRAAWEAGALSSKMIEWQEMNYGIKELWLPVIWLHPEGKTALVDSSKEVMLHQMKEGPSVLECRRNERQDKVHYTSMQWVDPDEDGDFGGILISAAEGYDFKGFNEVMCNKMDDSWLQRTRKKDQVMGRKSLAQDFSFCGEAYL